MLPTVPGTDIPRTMDTSFLLEYVNTFPPWIEIDSWRLSESGMGKEIF